MKAGVSLIAAISTVCLATTALAHHSFSMFDRDKTVTLTGMVKELEWTNPHAWLHMMVQDEKTGQPVLWSFEMGGVGQISGWGWKPDSVKPGDKVSVQMHPLKDHSHGGQYMAITLADGRMLGSNQDAARRPTQNVIQ